jgi:hypothetical protein
LFAAAVAAVVGTSCTTPQAPLECQFNPYYWADYKLTDPGTGGTCSEFQGDRIDFQRYLPPGVTKPTFAFLERRVGNVTRANSCNGTRDGRFFRTDPADPTFQKESPRGTFPDVYPNAAGFCASPSLVPSEQNFPELTAAMCVAAGITPPATVTLPLPALKIGDVWSNFRMLSTARFTATVWEADVKVTRDACTATYHVTGIFPPVGCAVDEDCNPDANLAAGRVTGSGLSKDFKPVCKLFTGTATAEKNAIAAFAVGATNSGACVLGEGVTIDTLAALK